MTRPVRHWYRGRLHLRIERGAFDYTTLENIAVGFLSDIKHERRRAPTPQERRRIEAIVNYAQRETEGFLTSVQAIRHLRLRPGESSQERSETAMLVYWRWRDDMIRAVQQAQLRPPR